MIKKNAFKLFFQEFYKKNYGNKISTCENKAHHYALKQKSCNFKKILDAQNKKWT